MALEATKGRKDIVNSGYYRVFKETDDDEEAMQIAGLCSRIQACVISNGCVLDGQIIPSKEYNANEPRHGCTSDVLDDDTVGHFAKFRLLKKHCVEVNNKTATELDYLVITMDSVEIYEIKDGDNFDTKKSQGEIKCLNIVRDYFVRRYPAKSVNTRIVLWNALDMKRTSVKAKEMMDTGTLLTGVAFCEKYDIDYDKISEARMKHGGGNRKYFWSEVQNMMSCNASLLKEFLERNKEKLHDVLSEFMHDNEDWTKAQFASFMKNNKEWVRDQLEE